MTFLPEAAEPFSGHPTLASLWSDVSGRDLAEWDLTWPADVFALVGSVLQRAHAYRFVVSPPSGRQWPPHGVDAWNAAVCTAGEEWCAFAEQPDGAPPPLVVDAWAVLTARQGVLLDDVADGAAWDVVEALITLMAASDEACAGIGGVLDPVRRAGHRFRARSSELLARTGSLSRISSYRLRVLPKVRTPPGGISFRSLSRYLCLREPSVGVTWHSVPSRPAGAPQQRHNVLLLPWPLRVRQRDFRPVPGSVRRAENEPFGFFDFAPVEPFDRDLLERTVLGALDEVDRVDAVVLPESAVPVAEVEPLEAMLARHGVWLFVAGVRSPAGGPAENRVHLGVRLGDTWTHHRQNKHHRWFLDGSQIEQYHIGGALHPSVRWWEAMEVPRRSVQLLELGDGLTLAAMVCEDLARLDEVAELLRDVGPTLVVTVLLDGPQLASRWTARYASVLADDPGSAVLTLTAYGMVQRSRPDGAAPSPVVALWKDPTRGLREIALEDGAQGVLVTVAAAPARRRVADGRTPIDNTTGLAVAGVHAVTALARAPAADGGPHGAPSVALDPAELTVVAAWASAATETLDGAAPHAADVVAGVVADALPGAAWRSELAVQPPAEVLDRALQALAADVRAVAEGHGGEPADVLAALPPPEPGPPALARRVLTVAAQAHRDRRRGSSARR